MIRRFVNVVTQKPGSNNGAYALHRLDVAKHLFFPSTAEAEAAAIADKVPQQSSNNGDKPQPTKQPLVVAGIDRLRRLPKPIVRFRQLPPTPTWRPLDDIFVLLSPGGAGAGAAGDRILHASKEGHGDVYDARSGSVVTTVPSPTLDGPNRVGVQPITFSIAAGGEKQDGRYLYVMTGHGGQSFQCLEFSSSQSQQHLLNLKWQPLPPAPFGPRSRITSFTTVESGSGSTTICVSTLAKGTYCFDTRTREWRHAGDWALPFDGRAQYVAELDAWLGFRSGRVSNGHHRLCASLDLAAAIDSDAHRSPVPPTLQHVWDDLVLHRGKEKVDLGDRFGGLAIKRWDDWRPHAYHPRGGHDLISLGGGRFCVVKAIRLEHNRDFVCDCDCSCSWDPELESFRSQPFHISNLVVLTGVEVLRGGVGDHVGGLRMVKHKSKRYHLLTRKEADDIKWIL